MTRMRNDDQIEWVRDVLAEYEAPLIRYAHSICGDLDRARDAVQDTFIRLCDADRERVEGYLAAWLYRVCRNRILEIMRKENRMQPAGDSPSVWHADTWSFIEQPVRAR